LAPEDVARGHVVQVELLLEPGRLRALATPWRTKDNSDHQRSIRILLRRRHHLRVCSASRASIAGSGPAGSPPLLSSSQRRVTSTYTSASVQPGSCSHTWCLRIASAMG